MSLLPVEDARSRMLAGIAGPLAAEDVPLLRAAGRTLATDLAARRTHPPFAASAMDGYAVRTADLATLPADLAIIGESAAGRRFGGRVGPGEAVRIFTGAPIPDGADAVVMQENATAAGARVQVAQAVPAGRFVRPAGLDFQAGETLLAAGTRLDERHVALAAAMGYPALPVHRRPRVAIVATGDELRRPGEPLGPDEIVASNLYAVAALVERAGGEALDLGIAGDRHEEIAACVAQARAARADVLVTLGGASVGEHDLVRDVLARTGMTIGFWRIAMRPGKPLIHGRLDDMLFLGLPGNPVSSMVCSLLFLAPAIRALVGDRQAGRDPSTPAILAEDMAANDARQDYVRARILPGADGPIRVAPFARQDSSMLRLFCEADALIVRAPHAPPARAGDPCRIVPLV